MKIKAQTRWKYNKYECFKDVFKGDKERYLRPRLLILLMTKSLKYMKKTKLKMFAESSTLIST